MKYPNKGGRYTREADGSLTQVTEATKTPDVPSEAPVAESTFKPKAWDKPTFDNPDGV